MPSSKQRLPTPQPPSKRTTKLLLPLEILLHIALAEILHFLLHHLLKTFPQRYWLLFAIPLCLLICDEFLRVRFMKKKKFRSKMCQGHGQMTVPKPGQGGKWQQRDESKARLARMQKLIDAKNAELGVTR
ncbi:Pre-mRNA-splicing factor ATP-dependent RNA helicase-like protein [Venturia nashicola]|nr:Pre-mRNA-splicing factor ATP-dependent RNA helicase-like protein [Venturia nashicola]